MMANIEKYVFFAGVCSLALAGTAIEVPWRDGAIVFDQPSQAGQTATLDVAAETTGVRFDVPAVLTGETLTMKAPATIFGGGTIENPLAGTGGLAISFPFWSAPNFYPGSGASVLWKGVKLASIIGMVGELTGAYIDRNYAAATMFFLEKSSDGQTATAQFHSIYDYLRSAKLQFTQVGDDVYVEHLWIKYTAALDKFGTDPDDTWRTYNLTSYGSGTLYMTRLRAWQGPLTLGGAFPSGRISITTDAADSESGIVRIVPSGNMTVANEIASAAKEIRFVGDKSARTDDSALVTFSTPTWIAATRPLHLVVDGVNARLTNRTLLNTGYDYCLALTNHAIFTVDSPSGSGQKVFPQTGENICRLEIGPDCQLNLTGSLDLVHFGVSAVVDAGEISMPYREHYLNDLTLVNGGAVTGQGAIDAGHTKNPVTRTRGAVPCTIVPTILSQGRNTAVESAEHLFDVEADLELQGGLLLNGLGSAPLDYRKIGSGTLTIGGRPAMVRGNVNKYEGAPGAFRIESGTVCLGGDQAFTRTNEFTLAGGMLASGTGNNELGTLTVESDSGLEVGSGTLTFRSSAAVVWREGARLSITGEADRLEAGRIRFGTDSTGLSADQLSHMRYNGKQRLTLTDEGWLESYKPGLALILR